MAPALRSAHDLAYTADLPPVPARVRSLDGQLVETAKDCWTIASAAMAAMRSQSVGAAAGDASRVLLATRAEHLVRLYLADRLARKKSSTIHNDFSTFLYFEDWLRNKAGVRRFDWFD